ncbi:hypothetical protein O6H91_21G007900 [Diphasiastrum complanatum]|nr:hypothetical protein O6H91_21G007900 [Diphasiastrum complanatum]
MEMDWKQQLEGLWVNKRKLKVEDVQPRICTWDKPRELSKGIQNESIESQKSMTVEEKASSGVILSLENLVNKCAGDITKTRDVCDAVTPLARIPYEEQLTLKKNAISQILKKLARNTRKCCADDVIIPYWLSSTKDRGGLCCDFEGIVASPLVDGYRNKCEFTVGYSPDGQPVVGFQLGMFREGITAVSEPSECRNVSPIARAYAAAFQDFIRKSGLPIWNKHLNTGFWRMLTVREGRAATLKDNEYLDSTSILEVMLIIQVCPAGVAGERSTMEYQEMVRSLSLAASAGRPQLPLTTILVQEHVGVSNAAPADAQIIPLSVPVSDDNVPDSLTGYIHDHMNGLKFRISPTAFFQVNTLAAERLYSLAGDWAGLGPDTLLFDVCCGTGTIGLTLARHVGMVVGIEMNASAVSDAWVNAKINDISNCRFVCAKAEDVISSLLNEYLSSSTMNTSSTTTQNDPQMDDFKPSCLQFTNVVVIVDPPRCGLHPVVVRTLRMQTQLRRVVYVSCNPESLLANAVELCTPISNTCKEKQEAKGQNRRRGTTNLSQARQRVKNMPLSEPFKPVKAIAVDLFPHTQHCEMVLLLER